jgi:deazaflavin-dependent oxidoreductase (nitroreductase family)
MKKSLGGTMKIKPYQTNWFFTAMKATLASRPGSWFFSRTLHIFDGIVLKLSGGRQTFTEILGGTPVITLTTIGAKSGIPRSALLVGLPDGDQIILIASNFGRSHHPAWYLNLRANPDVIVTYKGQIESYRAREAEGEERDQSWKMAVECYPGYELYRKRAGTRRIPVILLTPARK